jgi:hypothetical protein
LTIYRRRAVYDFWLTFQKKSFTFYNLDEQQHFPETLYRKLQVEVLNFENKHQNQDRYNAKPLSYERSQMMEIQKIMFS